MRKAKGMIFAGVLMVASVALLNQTFTGVVSARLPFTPFGFMQGMTHYGLEGDDMRQTGALCIFILGNMTLGQYLKKMLQLEGPRIA